jgi:dihydrofolate reductase
MSVIWHTPMSLDGFIAEPAEGLDWVFKLDPGDGQTTARILERLGALLVGRRTMDAEDRIGRGFYGGAFAGPFFVLTHRPDRPTPVVKGVEGTLLDAPITEAVRTAQEAAAGKDVGILGAEIAAQAMVEGLVDEIVVHVAPVLLGDGVPFYRGVPRDITLREIRQEGDFLTLTYATA